MTPRGLPMTLDEITPEWLTVALAARHPDVEVGAVSLGEPIHGTGTNLSVKLDYARPPHAGPALPATMWLKSCFEPHFAMMADNGLYEFESLFYEQLAPRLSVRLPHCFYTGADPVSRQGVLLLEDLGAAGATFGNATRPIDAEQVAVALDTLAQFHASTWGARWPHEYGFVTDGVPMDGPKAAWFLNGTPDVFRRYLADRTEANTPDSVNDPDRIVKAFWRLAAMSRDEPVCLIHSDAHLDNWYFLPDGTPGLLDWCSPRMSSWAWDVSYFVVSALTIDERRDGERHLLAHYLDRLRSHGVDAHPLARPTLRNRMVVRDRPRLLARPVRVLARAL